MTIVLGLNAYEINSSAAIIKNGIVEFAMCEERFTRKKRDKVFPFNSIQAGLKELNITFNDIDAIAVGWNPIVEAQKSNGTLGIRPRELYFYKLVEEFLSRIEPDNLDLDWSLIRTSGKSIPDIYFVRHHISHACNSIFQSPFNQGDFLSLDFQGEKESGSYGSFNNNQIEIKAISKQPRSTGAFYAAITQMIGYTPDSDEWKVMALSAAKSDRNKVNQYIEVFKESVADGEISPLLKNEYYNTNSPWDKYLTTSKLRELLDYPNEIKDRNSLDIRNWQINIATAMQLFISKFTLDAIKDISEKNNSKRDKLCLSGGFFMNCVFNSEIERSNIYKSIYISPSPADLGNSIGSAMYVYHSVLNNKRVNYKNHKLFSGISHEKELIKKLDNYQINYTKFDHLNDLVNNIVDELLKEKVIGINYGKSEFGERALGARSILALPKSKFMKDKINSKIKYREEYRPFAPVCPKESAHIYFEVAKDYECRSMEKVAFVRSEWIHKLEAITHFDNSARLQTVDKDENILLNYIFKEMEIRKEIPVLINTSFNLNGEPNVENIDDALRTFYTSGLDTLVLDMVIIRKGY